MNPVNFDPVSRELRFVPDFFKGKPSRFVSWRTGIATGAVIKVGTALAEIQWDDGKKQLIKSPVAGTIARTNRRIVHSTLQRRPAQLALMLT